jgi:glutaredoxin
LSENCKGSGRLGTRMLNRVKCPWCERPVRYFHAPGAALNLMEKVPEHPDLRKRKAS